eukprot:3723033-Pyramimonas_sp.AAC.1
MAEHGLDWYGQVAQKAEWRNKTLATMAAMLIDQMDSHKTKINQPSAVHLRFTHEWIKELDLTFRLRRMALKRGHLVSRVTMNLGGNQILQDIAIQDRPIGYSYNAPLPNGVTNIRIRFYWEQPESALIGQEDPRPRPRWVAFVDDDRSPPPSIERGR